MESRDRYDEEFAVRKEIQPERGSEHGETIDSSLTLAVVEAVAAASNTPPENLPPLYSVIDTEALERLFTPKRDGTVRPGCVRFEYYDHAVGIRDGRTVTVHPADSN